jgi:hypothetical protein
MRVSCRVKLRMLRGISSIGCVPIFSAKFSEWMPNASKPMGSNTVSPRSRFQRP